MSNVTRGLFDPRQRMQTWAEPNDDPNIPYAWGESGLGYALSGYRQNEANSKLLTPPTLNSPEVPFYENKYVKVAIGTSLALGVIGLIQGYSVSSEDSVSGKLSDSAIKGLKYATIVGIFLDEDSPLK